MPYVCSSLPKSVSGSACAGAANTSAGAIAAAAIEASLVRFMTYLSDRACRVVVNIRPASADADRSLGVMAWRFGPWHRPRPVSHVLRPPEPLAHHGCDRRRHERANNKRVEQQTETDRGAD